MAGETHGSWVAKITSGNHQGFRFLNDTVLGEKSKDEIEAGIQHNQK